MTTVLHRLSGLLENVFSAPIRLSENATFEPETADSEDERFREIRRFSREESYYWAMHAHW